MLYNNYNNRIILIWLSLKLSMYLIIYQDEIKMTQINTDMGAR